MSHGDIFTPWHYNLYCTIIRNKPLLVFLNLIDFGNVISKKIELPPQIKAVIDQQKQATFVKDYEEFKSFMLKF